MRKTLGVVLAAVALGGCGGGAAQKQADVCAAAWDGGVTAVNGEIAVLDEAGPVLAQRKTDADKAVSAAEKRLAGLTIKRDEALASYPDKVKGRVVSAKMRVGGIQPMREESGKPFAPIRYDLEIQGEHARVSKALAALYEQPKAIQLDRVEVNITDERKGWAITKVQFRVFTLTEPQPAPAAEPAVPASYTAALAWAPAGDCATAPVPSSMTEARAALQEREAIAKSVRSVEAIEDVAKSRNALADDLVRKRDDDRALWTAHADSIVENAKKSVTGLAELRFNAKGEPDWRN
ncbi:MAG TPA: hypothetical protein VM509_07930 [Planctomycetota bacterium]|nr:hypothetical protein [Planctomycetota bacterium]